MSGASYGPSMTDQVWGPDDMPIGRCASCDAPLDVSDYKSGRAVYSVGGTLYCDRHAAASPARTEPGDASR